MTAKPNLVDALMHVSPQHKALLLIATQAEWAFVNSPMELP